MTIVQNNLKMKVRVYPVCNFILSKEVFLIGYVFVCVYMHIFIHV